MATTLREIIGNINVTYSLLKKDKVAPTYAIDWLNSVKQRCDVKTEFKSITILVANVESQHRNKILMDKIKELHPMFVFIIESYAYIQPPTMYQSINCQNFYKNMVWIRNDVRKQKCISRTHYGIKIDNIGFRYIPPHSKKVDLDTQDIEVGDFNFLSNRWLKLENITCENRFGKPGGIAICSKYKYKTNFFSIGSDHLAMYTQIQGTIQAKKKVDVNKLYTAIQDAIVGRTNKDIYVLDKRWNEDRQIRLNKVNQKLINPKAQNLNLDPYKDLYHHNCNKRSNRFHVPQIRSNESKTIQSKAEDINNFQIKKMIELTKRLTLREKREVIFRFSWIKFDSRTVCLKKKNKEPNSVLNLRPIQISPWTFKIAEQSRTKLKTWLDQNTHPGCYAFKKKKKITDLIQWIKSYINT